MRSKIQPWFQLGNRSADSFVRVFPAARCNWRTQRSARLACGCAALLLFGWVCPLPGQPPAPEAVESALLVNAVNTGDYATALEILHQHGVTNTTVEVMAARLGRPAPRVALAEPFLKGWEPNGRV